MDQKQHDEILYRLDERTERIDGHLDRIDRRLRVVEEQLDQHEDRIADTENDLSTIATVTKGIGAAIVAFISGVGAKFLGLFGI